MARQGAGQPRFSERLDEAIKRAGITQRALASKLGVTEGTVSKWKNEANEPPIVALLQMREILGVTLDWLLGTPDAPPPSLVNVRTIRRAMQKLASVASALEGVGAAVVDLESALPPEE